MRDFFKKYSWLMYLVGSIVCLLLIFLLLKPEAKKQSMTPQISKNEFDLMLKTKLKNCQNEKEKYSCLKKFANELLEKYSDKEILAGFERNESDKNFFETCHTTLHYLGQANFSKKKDLAKILGEGNPVCFAGYYHGALEEYLKEIENNTGEFNKEKIYSVVPNLCSTLDARREPKKYNECLHGLGHALMYLTDNELPESLKYCDTLNNTADQEWCYSGVFMENSTSSTNRDHPSKYLKPQNPEYPCNILEKKYKKSCYMLQSFFFAELQKFDWQKTFLECKKIPIEYQSYCANAVGQNQVGYTQDYKIIHSNCQLGIGQNLIDSCIEGVIGAFFERYNNGGQRAAQLCNFSKTESSQEHCIEKLLFHSTIQAFTNEQKLTLCGNILNKKNQLFCQSLAK